MSCSLNLASCRMRAEALARQLHNNLWVPRSHQGSPGDSGTVSPSFGFPGCAFGVIDRPPGRIDKHLRMSSLDDDETVEVVVVANGTACSSQVSPPYSPLEKMGLLPQNGAVVYDKSKDADHVWRPDSPPESFTSESDLHSDSPALTLEVEDPGSSVETVSELASPTYDYSGEDSPLADELRTRLRLIQSSQTTSATTPDDTSLSSTLSSASTSKDAVSSPEPCPRLVRSTSLKTGKTPPGTPSRKKIVRFADVLGLDLEAIRHFAKDDDAPIVPLSAFADLRLPSSASAPQFHWNTGSGPSGPAAGCRFVPQFEQPGTNPRFLDKVRQQKVCLEDVVVSDLRLTGFVRVLNLGFEKLVQVRYTTTEWAAHADLGADYVPSSCDGFSDKFTFNLDLPHLTPGQRLLFALRYVANGQEFWDNNGGDNYVLKCQAKPPDQQEPVAVSGGPRWLHHFM